MEFLEGLSQKMKNAAASSASQDFSRIGMHLVKSRDQARELLQDLTALEIKPLIRKLENNQPLTPEEKDLVRLWIVGDAESYIQMEDDFQEWRQEFQRLSQVIAGQEDKKPSLPELLTTYGVLQDAVRVAADIQFFLENKERVQRFEKAIQNLEQADARLLADLLKAKLTSEEM
jgi:hypothetical protein